MYRPQKLVAALFSAALLCTTGLALADKGGNHDKHGGGSSNAPGQSSSAATQRGAGNVGHPQSAPGPTIQSMDRNNRTDGGSGGNEFEGSVDTGLNGSAAADGSISIKMKDGASRMFRITAPAAESLKEHGRASSLIFFTINGREITAVSARGEKDDMRVVARAGDTFTLEDSKGQERLIVLDSKTASRLQVKVGCHLRVTPTSETSGKIVALDLEKKHDFDKFRKSDVDVAKLDVDRQNVDNDTKKVDEDRTMAKTDVDRDVAKLDIDRRDVDQDQVKLDIDKAKGKKSDIDFDTKKLDIDRKKCDRDVAQIDFDTKGKKAKKSDVDVAKADIDTKAKRAKKSSSDVDVADVGVAGRGKCGHGSSRNGNPAFANQMAKDAANDASGHNPPGLPHECVNPAGHTRGFCKSGSSESICGGGVGSGGGETELAANISKPCAPGTSSKSHTNPAFANQMAKDEANDISGHNPPGLPHECINPAGHTRGFCKTSESSSPAMCGGGMGSGENGGVSPSELHGGIASASPVRGTQPGVINGGNGSSAANAGVPVRGFQPGVASGSGGSSNAGTTVRGFQPGVVPVGRGAAGAPTHVLGASVGPTSARRVAALPTRVLPVEIQPVGKRRCVWYKTGVLATSSGPYRIVGTSATGGKIVLHKKCR